MRRLFVLAAINLIYWYEWVCVKLNPKKPRSLF